MKIGLSSDFGAPEHWRRLVDFAKEHGVSQLVYWAVGSGCCAGRPFLFPKYPGLLGPEERQQIVVMREKLRQAAAMRHEAGIGFWFSFHMCTNKTNPGFPDTQRLNALIPVLADLAARWDKRQPHDEYHISRRLRAWHKELIKSLDERGLQA